MQLWSKFQSVEGDVHMDAKRMSGLVKFDLKVHYSYPDNFTSLKRSLSVIAACQSSDRLHC